MLCISLSHLLTFILAGEGLTGSGGTDISRIAQSIYARLDKATATTEIRAASLDEQIDQQLAERMKKPSEKSAYPLHSGKTLRAIHWKCFFFSLLFLSIVLGRVKLAA